MIIDYLSRIATGIRVKYGKEFDFCPHMIGLIILQMLNHDEPITYESLLKKIQDSEVNRIIKCEEQ